MVKISTLKTKFQVWKERLWRFCCFLIGWKPKLKLKQGEDLKIAVIIPAYDEEDNIKETIESIKNQSKKVDRIIVVDDCSTDNTVAIAEKEGAEVIKTPENTGTKSQAQNYALDFIDKKEFPVIVTVDADTTINEKALEYMLPHLHDSQVASVCGFVIPRKTNTLWERARLIQYLYYISLNKGVQNHWGVPLVSSGCFSVFNARLLKQFDGFPDETMAEDMDLTWRYLMKGFEVRLEPSAICYPIDPDTYPLYRSQVQRWYRSFLQNISLHRWKLFKNKKLASFIYFYLISGLITPVFWIMLGVMLFNNSISGPVKYLMAFTLSLEFILVNAISIYKGVRLGKGWVTILSLPCYWITVPVETYLFLKSVFLEWIKKERLIDWEKGH